MKKSILACLLLVSLIGFGQQSAKEINEQVWKPFTEAIMSQDVEKFISLHSKDLVRAERDGKRVLTYDQYKTRMEQGWPKWKESNAKNKVQYTFELRFLERISNETQAFEVGYFKNLTIAEGKKQESYGQFHVALRKENGVWKILVDSDSNNGKTITEEMFLAAKPLE
ncbi:MAG TPA: nuclear transport factor 2 family protein [Cyclobacteriaceae bacterium]|nr:nuclear transport factor 2 family protein [Cyclobacteriaceae bacterium]